MSSTFETGLVTGASAGLGEEFATQLSQRLARLVLVARRGERLEEIATELRARFEVEVLVLSADLAESSERERVYREVRAHGWTVDVLVNNAGLGDYGEFRTSEWPRNEAMLRVNVEALTHLAHLFLPTMIASEGGAIINVSSLASTLPIPDFAVYAATKAYVSSFSEALRMEVREFGVEVLAVCPGPVQTEFGKVAARSEGGPGMPGGRENFYVPRQQVVAESLAALEAGRARVYPGWKVAAAAAGISLLPMFAIRLIMASRPRRQKLLE
ncbi:SDR family NAD(P)-dependent oxidoreductase [Roseibacillus persicicus]|uniref:Dehydrogenase n=1 Tax=Roseibacillus persicicus TaxID=454148 RepID=A0A918TCQ8_9BACT|nr:SDR family oxidoreductase [Roseibacillus persicicus]GHC43151.1 dehydrogenase [Roseibacillus persicicus]